jgi:hypothetical protein
MFLLFFFFSFYTYSFCPLDHQHPPPPRKDTRTRTNLPFPPQTHSIGVRSFPPRLSRHACDYSHRSSPRKCLLIYYVCTHLMPACNSTGSHDCCSMIKNRLHVYTRTHIILYTFIYIYIYIYICVYLYFFCPCVSIQTPTVRLDRFL